MKKIIFEFSKCLACISILKVLSSFVVFLKNDKEFYCLIIFLAGNIIKDKYIGYGEM